MYYNTDDVLSQNGSDIRNVDLSIVLLSEVHCIHIAIIWTQSITLLLAEHVQGNYIFDFL